MRTRFTRLVLLAAWLVATGAHWDAVQVFAWGRMLAQNVQVLPWLDAIEATFTPAERCELCLVVQDATRERREDAAAALNSEVRMPLVFQCTRTVVQPALGWTAWRPSDDRPWEAARSAPLLPPPRARAA